MYVDFNDNTAVVNDLAILYSEMQSEVLGSGDIFHLWYYMNGENVGTFQIKLHVENESLMLFNLTGSQYDRWEELETTLNVFTEYYISLEAIWAEHGPGILAIDDISVSNVVLSSSLCDFEHDFCEWSQFENISNIEWKRAFGLQNFSVFPDKDHSTNTEYGYFAYLDNSVEGSMGILESPTYENTGPQCMQLWYHMVGSGVGTLSVAIRDIVSDTAYTTVWSTSENAYDMWYRRLVPVIDIPRYRIRIIGVSGSNARSVMAIDDTELIPDACPPEYFCDFETDSCFWTNADTEIDTFSWTLTSYAQDGPEIDHSLQSLSGHYLLADLSNRTNSERCSVVSASIPSSFQCFKLYFSMQYTTNAKLVITVIESANTTEYVIVGMLNDGDIWEEYSISVNAKDDVYKISVSVTVNGDFGSPEYHTVSVDDLSFSEACDYQPGTTSETSTPGHLPSTYDCDFETTDYCSWVTEGQGQNWTYRGGPSNPLSETGPSSDHTTHEGHYVYVKTLNQTNATSRLISPEIYTGEDGICLAFWYHMFGFNVGSLSIRTINQNDNESPGKWFREGEEGDQWNSGMIFFQAESHYRLAIDASPQLSGYGDIALDDITVDFDQCHSKTMCTFEHGSCNFEQLVSELWVLFTITSATLNPPEPYIPQKDHTYQAPGGHYFIFNEVGQAQFTTPKISSEYKCVSLWLYSRGNGENNDGKIQISSDGMIHYLTEHNLGPDWVQITVRFDIGADYTMKLEAYIYSSNYMIGVDDISPEVDCDTTVECSFERGKCAWINVYDDNFDWSVNSGDRLRNDYGPPVDMTQGTPFGPIHLRGFIQRHVHELI